MKVPYQLVAAVSVDQRCAQMAYSIQVANERGYLRLEDTLIEDTRTLSIACYGPSLQDTWQAITHPILSMSGATRFLADHGIIADYHVDMDPRLHKAKHLDPPVDGVHYLMASVSPPKTWELLKGQRVTLWHTYSGKNSEGKDSYAWVADHDFNQLVIRGGSTIGLTAMHIGGVLGYRHFEIHGMDGSYADASRASRHAGPHFGKAQKRPKTWNAEGRMYHTSEIMANAVAETINTIRQFPMFCVFHGDGLTQALVREADVPNACTANQSEKAALVRRSYVRRVEMPETERVTSYWDALVDVMHPQAVVELIAFKRKAEALRVHAQFNTGSIPIETALLLRAICDYHQPRVVAEIGTFIGLSTYALHASRALYTCDKDNDCLAADVTRHIRTHPKMTSTAMFQQMLDDGLEAQVDLFFFDGRIQRADLDLIQRLAHARTVFTFDDCSTVPGANKGLANIALLKPLLQDYVIAPPVKAYTGRSTLGALLPLVADEMLRKSA